MDPFYNKVNKKIFWVNVLVFVFVFCFVSLFVSIMLNKVSSPYSKKESLYWLYKYFFGLRHQNPGKIQNHAANFTVNENTSEDFVITFVGDFLPINKKKIIFSEELKHYIRESDFLIGDFEGVITPKVREPTVWDFDMRYDRGVLNLFRKIINPQKILLSVANNHAFDFGRKELDESNHLLKGAGVEFFGTEGRPYIDLQNDIRIVGVTQWLNKKDKGILLWEDGKKFVKEGAFNILYPHWGYAFELYPRKETIVQAQDALGVFDAIIGQHSYCPQPVTMVGKGKEQKLIAYSLGTFLGEVYEKKYQYGLILKLFLGKNDQGERVVVKVEYRTIKCSELINKDFLVDFTSEKIGAFN